VLAGVAAEAGEAAFKAAAVEEFVDDLGHDGAQGAEAERAEWRRTNYEWRIAAGARSFGVRHSKFVIRQWRWAHCQRGDFRGLRAR